MRFNLVIERLLISGNSAKPSVLPCKSKVSISLSSGFSFQGTSLCMARRLLQSFNLVIERLLISGKIKGVWLHTHSSFNLVIERLLISGQHGNPLFRCLQVSISLSSGFSFQGNARAGQPSSRNRVSISLSSGFSFQVRTHMQARTIPMFQSRYRAASHFRKSHAHAC